MSTMRTTRPLLILALALGVVAPAFGQSLFQRRSDPPPTGAVAEPARSLASVSLYMVEPPHDRVFAPNDLITIIVREESRTKREQKVKEDKSYDNTITLLNRTLLNQFLQFRLPTAGQTQNDIDLASSTNTFDGKGKYDRTDTIESRITARVLEVKPNGTLLLEAKSVTKSDQETQTILLSGLCRGKDVTASNTILSTQIYGLNLNMQHEGQVRRATKKGVLARVIETIFNF